MRTLFLVPDIPNTAAWLDPLLRSLAPVCEVTVSRSSASSGEWREPLTQYQLVLAYLPCGEEFSLTPQWDAYRAVALSLLKAAAREGIPRIAFGPALDNSLRLSLIPLGPITFVSTKLRSTLVDALVGAVQLAAQPPSAEAPPLSVMNARTEIHLELTRGGIRWESRGSFIHGFEMPQRTEPQWIQDHPEEWREAFAHFSHDGGARVKRAGKHLGSHLLPSPDGHDFYQAVLQSHPFGKSDEIPVYIYVDPDWIQIPLELAVLPTWRLLSHSHPAARMARRRQDNRPWRPPPGRPLRVLLIGADTAGEIQTCRYNDRACVPAAGLAKLKHTGAEVDRLQDFFLSGGLCPVDRDSLTSLSGLNATYDKIAAALQKEWDIIHFAGHGVSCRRDETRSSCLLLSVPGPTPSTDVPQPKAVHKEFWIENLCSRSPNALIYLSCCHAADGYLCHDIALGRGSQVIGFLHTVGDEAATHIADAFYRALLSKDSPSYCDVSATMYRCRLAAIEERQDIRLAAQLCTVYVGPR